MSILPQLEKTRHSAPILARSESHLRSQLMLELAAVLRKQSVQVLAENEKDQARLPDSDPKKDRLRLTSERMGNLALSVEEIALLPDPSGQILLDKKLANGLHLQKKAVPLGVVGVIYESRPNVTIDVAALCLRSGNAVVLKGGKEAEHSNKILVECLHEALRNKGLPEELVLLLPPGREYVAELLAADRFVDILIPRGSEALIQFVRKNSSIPTIETGAGVVHTYVHSSADKEKGIPIIVNAKTSRPSVCNALDCLLLDQNLVENWLPDLGKALEPFQVEMYADPSAFQVLVKSRYPFLKKASEEDFGKEWLDFKLSIRTVANEEEALAHIAQFSSRHSEAILAESQEVIQRFLNEVDASAVYANASTRFTDGGEFGLGAEIGISTQKLHARGPFALEKLVTEKWVVVGNGQTR
jgi:glutamate-5-semialdehyde dehydrogenase